MIAIKKEEESNQVRTFEPGYQTHIFVLLSFVGPGTYNPPSAITTTGK